MSIAKFELKRTFEYKHDPKVIRLNSDSSINNHLADIFIKEFNNNPKLKVGVAFGTIPMDFFQKVTNYKKEHKLDFSKVVFYNLFTYLNIDKNDFSSTETIAKNYCINVLELNDKNLISPSQQTLTHFQYSEEDQLDLIIAAVGSNGNIIFNHTPFRQTNKLHIEQLYKSDKTDLIDYFSTFEKIPSSVLTIGIDYILNAKKIIIIARGINNAIPVKALLSKVVDDDYPITCLLEHSDVTIIANNTALSKLQ